MRRLVVVLLLLVGAHWLAVTALTTYDGWRIARFKEASGAADLPAYLRGRVTSSWIDNGWGHCVAALSCLTDETTDTTTWNAEKVAERERQLDMARRALDAARDAPRTLPVLVPQYGIGFQPETYPLQEFAAASVQSARTALRAGDASLAEARLDDAWFLSDSVASLPMATSIIVRDSTEAALCGVVADHLRQWSPAFLRACSKRLSWDWEVTVLDCLRGEVYNHIAWCERASSGGGPLGFSPTGLVTAIDRHRRLSVLLDAIDDPYVPPAPLRVGWKRAVLGPGFTLALGYYARQRAANRAVVREAIRLERARRETGTVPAPTTKVGGFTIASKQTPAGIELTTPDAKPSIKVLVKP